MLIIESVEAGYPLGLGIVTSRREYTLTANGSVITVCDDLELLKSIKSKIEESQ